MAQTTRTRILPTILFVFRFYQTIPPDNWRSNLVYFLSSSWRCLVFVRIGAITIRNCLLPLKGSLKVWLVPGLPIVSLDHIPISLYSHNINRKVNYATVTVRRHQQRHHSVVALDSTSCFQTHRSTSDLHEGSGQFRNKHKSLNILLWESVIFPVLFLRKADESSCTSSHPSWEIQRTCCEQVLELVDMTELILDHCHDTKALFDNASVIISPHVSQSPIDLVTQPLVILVKGATISRHQTPL
mmetsp:Transcript_14839/g.26824  ORF Transcript_14839/g.26824 Transcript_14839/m.26824 type:complete len:243 (-) Transcript_14839:2887-3615(-)